MNKAVYLIIAFILAYVFIAPAKASFNPSSQTVVDYGNVSDEQIAEVEASTPTTTTTTYDWFTPALQAELDSVAGSNSFIDWSSVNSINY